MALTVSYVPQSLDSGKGLRVLDTYVLLYIWRSTEGWRVGAEALIPIRGPNLGPIDHATDVMNANVPKADFFSLVET